MVYFAIRKFKTHVLVSHLQVAKTIIIVLSLSYTKKQLTSMSFSYS